MKLLDALTILDNYEEYINSIEFDGSSDDFKILVECESEEYEEWYHAYLHLFSDGSSTIEYKISDEEHECEYIVLDNTFIELLLDICAVWRDCIEFNKISKRTGKKGEPKYKIGDIVKFTLKDDDNKYKTLEGRVFIIDTYGTFEQNEQPSYDIMVDSEEGSCLYKHIVESLIEEKL